MINYTNYDDFLARIQNFCRLLDDSANRDIFVAAVIDLQKNQTHRKITKKNFYELFRSPMACYPPTVPAAAAAASAPPPPVRVPGKSLPPFAGLIVGEKSDGSRQVFLHGLWRIGSTSGQNSTMGIGWPIQITTLPRQPIALTILFTKPYLIKRYTTFEPMIFWNTLERRQLSVDQIKTVFANTGAPNIQRNITLEERIERIEGSYLGKHLSDSCAYNNTQYHEANERAKRINPTISSFPQLKNLYEKKISPIEKHYKFVPLVRGLDLANLLKRLENYETSSTNSILFNDILVLCKNVLLWLCDLVDGIHQAGILHFDIKLDNIVFYRLNTKPTPTYQVKFIDFDLSLPLNEPCGHLLHKLSPYYRRIAQADPKEDIRALLHTMKEWLSRIHTLLESKQSKYQSNHLSLELDNMQELFNFLITHIGNNTTPSSLQELKQSINKNLTFNFGQQLSANFDGWFKQQSKYPENDDHTLVDKKVAPTVLNPRVFESVRTFTTHDPSPPAVQTTASSTDENLYDTYKATMMRKNSIYGSLPLRLS